MKRIQLFLVLLTLTFTLIGCKTKEIEIGDNVFVIIKNESGEGEQRVVTFSIIEGTVKKVQTYNGVLEFIVADKKLIPSNFSVQEQNVFLKYEDAMKELKKKTPPTNNATT